VRLSGNDYDRHGLFRIVGLPEECAKSASTEEESDINQMLIPNNAILERLILASDSHHDAAIPWQSITFHLYKVFPDQTAPQKKLLLYLLAFDLSTRNLIA
jgi:hypothetical protein